VDAKIFSPERTEVTPSPSFPDGRVDLMGRTNGRRGGQARGPTAPAQRSLPAYPIV
jgi:hypothetical protein